MAGRPASARPGQPRRRTGGDHLGAARLSRAGRWQLWNRPLDNAPGGAGEFVWFDIVADGFLYNMVRAIMGSLVKVGQQKWTAGDMRKIIENQDRAQAGETAPPQGLYLVQVDYD